MSVKVTAIKPPSAREFKHDSKNGTAVPYGSRSTTSNKVLFLLYIFITSIASSVQTKHWFN